jgi:xanthine/CO dehydrogenase XdhC/CoxF family maturation factor
MWRRGEAAALVTLVRVEGSSYRKVGARLLVGSDGRYAGSISGGCLEAEVVRKAPWIVRSGAVIKTYSTLFDDTAEIPYGLGCGGTVDLLMEPVETPEFQALMEALATSLDGASHHVTTWLPGPGMPLRRLVQPAATEGMEQMQSVFAETILPPQRLIIFGAGDDAVPMVEAASLLGWRVVVVDGRPQLARAQRFLQARQVLVAKEFGELDSLSIGDQDALVIMTHSYEQDKTWLMGALQCRPRYLGLLGARHRSALLISETAAAMGWSLEQICEALFAPVGLNLGGDGAEAIALAVIAEIQGYLNGKIGASRRMSAPMVIAQAEQGRAQFGAPGKIQSRCAL